MAYLGVLAFIAFIVAWNWWFNGRYWQMLSRYIFGAKKPS